LKRTYKDDIDFDDPRLINAIENLDLFDFLDTCNVTYALEGKNIGDGFIGIEECPSCGKGNFHFGIHKELKFGSCLVCKDYYSPLKMVAVFKEVRIKQAFDYLIEDSEYEMDVEERVKQILKPRRNGKEKERRGIDRLPTNVLITRQIIKNNKVLHRFLRDRKIKIWDICKYDLRLGVEEHRDKIIFPVYSEGKLVSYQWRRLSRKQYHIPPNLPKYLLWEDEISSKKTLIITEGFLDALHLRSFVDMYFPSQYNVTTGFTKSLSAFQEEKLAEKSPKNIICMLDAFSWYEYFHKFKNKFSFDVDYVILPTINGKESDPNSLTFGELKEVFIDQII
jgi:hypothetical protein